MLKKVFSIFLALSVGCICLFSACGENSDSVDLSIDENKKVELEFFVWGDRQMNQKIADDFHTLHPNWTVNVSMPSGQYYDTLSMYAGSDMLPDIFYMSSSLFSDYARDERLLNLQPYIEKSKILKETDLWQQNDNFRFDADKQVIDKENGDLYGYIKDISPDYTMIYNKAHIDEYDTNHSVSLAQQIGYPTDEDGKYPSEQIPMTWAQNLEFCSKLTKFDKSGNIQRYGSSFVFEPWTHIQQMVLQSGETLFDADGYYKETNALSDSLEHMKLYMDTTSQYRSAALVGSSGGSTLGDGAGFKNGDISVVWNARCAITAYDWQQADFEFGVAPSPVPTAAQHSKMVASGVGLCLSAASKNPAVAYQFLEYYMTVGQKYTAKIGYNIPGNKTIAGKDYLEVEDEFVRNLNKLYYSYMAYTEIMEVNPYVDNTTLFNCYNMYYPKIWSSTTDKMTTAAAIKVCKTLINKKVDQNKSRLGL